MVPVRSATALDLREQNPRRLQGQTIDDGIHAHDYGGALLPKAEFVQHVYGSVVLGVNNSGETIQFQFSKGPFHPRGSGFGRQSFAPKRLCKTESEVDPSIVGQEQQSRVSDRLVGSALHDDPLAEAVVGLMVLVVGDPRGCLFDAAISSTRGEPHDQGIAKPTKRHRLCLSEIPISLR